MEAGAREVTLGELCEIVSGPSGSWLAGMSAELEGGVPVVTPADITEYNRVDHRGMKRVGRDAAAALPDRYRLRAGQILMVRQAVVGLGRRALVRQEEDGWLFATSCVLLTVTSERLLPQYLVHYLGSTAVRSWLSHYANPGQAVSTINARELAWLPVVLPDLAEQQVLAGALDEIDRQMLCNAEENRRLVRLGQALLTEKTGGRRRTG
ncbi:restriction endonuclease subunit S [Streptomyces sp. YIM 98790]|uniref:restriction endonuclease subunit S n=1 Tax=Streptomyces sp. YIM 98790 TaxID=2689077 RepID=UPI001408F086|nr:restriction endonuclease subunit S [Streptomyces sp. YIM 98790]